MKLFKFTIKTYIFGTKRYHMFVLADSEENARKTVYADERYRRDDEAEIEGVTEIDLTDTENRVL